MEDFEVVVVIKGSFKVKAKSELDYNAKLEGMIRNLEAKTDIKFEVESEEGTAELFLK